MGDCAVYMDLSNHCGKICSTFSFGSRIAVELTICTRIMRNVVHRNVIEAVPVVNVPCN